jgi:GNAT superfamily N-acetyltransferase
LRLTPARTGDHGLIHQLLLSVFHGPSAAEFHAQLDEPLYEPADRLVVRDGEQIAAHLRLARQTICVGPATLPAARFMDLATAQEYRGRGLATTMLAAAERAAAERGVLVGLTRTRVPSLFARLGWAVCGQHNYSAAAPRAVLAELSATAARRSNAHATTPLAAPMLAEPIVVRPLRRIELPALIRLYDQQLAGRSGWPLRSEAYWDWLLARASCDRIFVASTGSETAELPKLLASIVGYAFVQQSRLVEVCAAAGRDDVAEQLAARVCADASEQGEWLVRCDAPPEHALHDLFRRAGGQVTCSTEAGGEVFMAKLLDPLTVLRQLAPLLHSRARAAGLPRPSELGIELRTSSRNDRGVIERFRLKLTPRAVRIETGGPSRHTIALRSADLAPLLLGECPAEEMLAGGRLRAGTRKAGQLATGLFPAARWWRPPLDDLLA